MSTACSASFGPIARAASRPVAPSGSSSLLLSGRTTFTRETLAPELHEHPPMQVLVVGLVLRHRNEPGARPGAHRALVPDVRVDRDARPPLLVDQPARH